MFRTLASNLTYQGIPVWRHVQVLQWPSQIVSAIVVVVLVLWFFANIGSAIQDRDIPYGFDFLTRAYQTPIGQHFLPYESSDTFRYALVVAAANTLIVAVVGIILAIALGIVVGVGRLSRNWLVARIATVYVEFFRNVPLLVQLFFWFYIFLALPTVRESYVFADSIYVNNGGVSLPWPTATGGGAGLWLALAVLGAVMGVVVHRGRSRREAATGQTSSPLLYGIGAFALVALVGWGVTWVAFGDSPLSISQPAPEGAFSRISGGFTASAGLLALLVGLVIYTSSFIAEIVRAGIQSVGRGQTEAGHALGLSSMSVLRQVTFPQALRVIIPPLISQCLNLTKNSSLAGAIGYSDLTNVAKTMTQTAPAVSIFIIIMVVYLAMSLTWSLIGNLYNRRIRFEG